MDEPERSHEDREPAPVATTVAVTPSNAWVDDLPPPPFVDRTSTPGQLRFAPLSPRVAVLIAAAIVLGVLLWMARDAVRPFVVGLLLVYLLEPPVRWLARRGMRRTIAILLVYVVAILGIVELVSLTITPLVDELIRFAQDLPGLATQLQTQIERVSEIYSRLQLPDAVRNWIDSMIAGIGQGGSGQPVIDISIFFPVLTGAGSFIGAVDPERPATRRLLDSSGRAAYRRDYEAWLRQGDEE